MFQMLFIKLQSIANFAVAILSGVYNTVGKIYNFLMEIVAIAKLQTGSFENVINNMYIIVAIYMLFRLIIIAVQYIIDPEKVDDKQSGAGKIIGRVVISLALIMVFPRIHIFLLELQNILIDPNDGLVYTIFDDGTKNYSSDNILGDPIEETHNGAYLNCYYVVANGNPGNNMNVNGTLLIFGIYKLAIYEQSVSNSHYLNGYYYRFENEAFNYQLVTGNIGTGGVNNYVSEIKPRWLNHYYYQDGIEKYGCPGKIIFDYDKNSNSYSIILINTIGALGIIDDSYQNNRGYGGYDNLNDAVSLMGNILRKFKKYDVYYGEETNTLFSQRNVDINNINPKTSAETLKILIGLSENRATGDGLIFARRIAATFITCYKDEECEDIMGEMFANSTADDALSVGWQSGGGAKKEVLEIDWLFAIIIAIVLAVFLLVLIIEVVVRNLKFLILELLSPIAFVSRIDPKDKIFDNWLKAYFGTYIDLFIKIFVISIVIFILNSDIMNNYTRLGGWGTIFFIMGLLVFAKTLPNFVSKILGIENMMGTFKDSMNMLKSAAGGAIGGGLALGSGLVGAGIGIASAKGANKIGAALQGVGTGIGKTFKGISSGTQGKVFEGAKSAWQKNARRNSAYANGATFGSIVEASTLGLLGGDYAQRKDKEIANLEAEKSHHEVLSNTKGAFEGLSDSNKAVASMQAKAAQSGDLKDRQKYEKMRDATTKFNLASTDSQKESANNDILSSIGMSNLQSEDITNLIFMQNQLSKVTDDNERARITNKMNSTLKNMGADDEQINQYMEMTKTTKQESYQSISKEATEVGQQLGIKFNAAEDYDNYSKIAGEQKGIIQKINSTINVTKSSSKYKSSQEANKIRDGKS